MSIEAVDKGTFWSCDRQTARMEFGHGFFFIPELVAKKGTFSSPRDACADLVGRITREIEVKSEVIRRLYAELEKTREFIAATEQNGIQGLYEDADDATLYEKPGSASEPVGGEDDGEESDGGQGLHLRS